MENQLTETENNKNIDKGPRNVFAIYNYNLMHWNIKDFTLGDHESTDKALIAIYLRLFILKTTNISSSITVNIIIFVN